MEKMHWTSLLINGGIVDWRIAQLFTTFALLFRIIKQNLMTKIEIVREIASKILSSSYKTTAVFLYNTILIFCLTKEFSNSSITIANPMDGVSSPNFPNKLSYLPPFTMASPVPCVYPRKIIPV